MIRGTLEELGVMIHADIAASICNLQIEGVSTDTRNIHSGQLYIPLIGDNYDGHMFIEHAFTGGAAAALWQRDHGDAPQGQPIIVVDDTLQALQQLAASYRKQLAVQVIAITGSNGKTSTKDMIAAIMAARYRVHKTPGNLNTHIGLPLTLLGMDPHTDFCVLELGMRNVGEIELLSHIACPNVSVITNIGESHLQQLGSREAIARAKFEIVTGLNKTGVLIYNGEEPLLRQLVEAWESSMLEKTTSIRFGEEAGDNHYYPGAVKVEAERTSFAAHIRASNSSIAELVIPYLGRHNATNAMAAIAVAEFYGIDEQGIREGLLNTIPTSMRLEVEKSQSGITILDDAYNASPSSMRAAIEFLEQLEGYSHKIVVLGDMLELGSTAESMHREMGTIIKYPSIDYVFTFGELAAYIAETCKSSYPDRHVIACKDKSELLRQVASIVISQDIVLVKGSRGMRLEEIVKALKQI